MKFASLGMILAFASSAFAQLSKFCPSNANGACYSVNVPDATAAGSQTDIYIQIVGPSTGWIGLGQGGQNRMQNSNIIIIYPNASGSNVTLSPRLGSGEFEPQFNSKAQVSLLEGSGVVNGKMTANIRCSSCANWDTGSMDLTSSSTAWIWAFKGSSPNSDSQTAGLSKHDIMGNIKFDLQAAKGGNSLNPFSSSAQATGSGTASAGLPAATTPSVNAGGSDGSQGFDRGMVTRARIAHGTIMGLAFALFFPMGGIIIRVLSFRGFIWVHAGLQTFTYALVLAGMGLGVYIARKPDNQLNEYHPIIGLVVIGLLAIQPFGGLAHHAHFKKYHARSIWSHAHIWLGRIVITLGIINGGFGLKLSDNTTKGKIAYSVVAVIIWLLWMGVAVFKEVKRGSGNTGEMINGEKRYEGSGGSEERRRDTR